MIDSHEQRDTRKINEISSRQYFLTTKTTPVEVHLTVCLTSSRDHVSPVILPLQRKARSANSKVRWTYGTDLTWTRKYDHRCTFPYPTKPLTKPILCPSPSDHVPSIIIHLQRKARSPSSELHWIYRTLFWSGHENAIKSTTKAGGGIM